MDVELGSGGKIHVPMTVSKIRVPHGAAATHSGWFTFVRGGIVPRRHALRVLLGGYRGKIETVQSDDAQIWGF